MMIQENSSVESYLPHKVSTLCEALFSLFLNIFCFFFLFSEIIAIFARRSYS